MIVVHHLNASRSQRILWLLEELGVPYEIKRYERMANRLAPPELKAVHPLGKSPVIEEDGRVIAESGAIVDYLIERHGGGRFAPAKGGDAWWDYVQWLHFAEGSAMTPLLMSLYVGMLGDAGAMLRPRIAEQMGAQLGYLSDKLGDRDWLIGDEPTGADILMSFVVEASSARGPVKEHPNLVAYLERIHARPAYKRAEEKGGVLEILR